MADITLHQIVASAIDAGMEADPPIPEGDSHDAAWMVCHAIADWIEDHPSDDIMVALREAKP